MLCIFKYYTKSGEKLHKTCFAAVSILKTNVFDLVQIKVTGLTRTRSRTGLHKETKIFKPIKNSKHDANHEFRPTLKISSFMAYTMIINKV